MLPLTLHEFRRFYYDIYSSWISWIYRDKHGTFCFFCKMVINKTIQLAISLSNRSCPYEFNASIDCWLKTTSRYNVIAPSTVSTTQNAKLLPSPNLCHSLMLCQPITGELSTQRPVMRSYDVFFALSLAHQLNKQWIHRWFKIPSRLFLRHCNGEVKL